MELSCWTHTWFWAWSPPLLYTIAQATWLLKVTKGRVLPWVFQYHSPIICCWSLFRDFVHDCIPLHFEEGWFYSSKSKTKHSGFTMAILDSSHQRVFAGVNLLFIKTWKSLVHCTLCHITQLVFCYVVVRTFNSHITIWFEYIIGT